MGLDPKKRDGVEYEHHEVSWTTGIGRPAGVYWLDGRSVIAGHGSTGEERLLAAGAVLVATLLFERDPMEGSMPGHSVTPCAATRVTRDFFTAGVN